MSDPVAPDPRQPAPPGQDLPREQPPGAAAPGAAAPGAAVPGAAVPEAAAPWRQAAGEVTPAQQALGESAPGEPAPKESLVGKIIVRIIFALAIGISVFALKAFLFGDKAAGAQVGDCIETTPATDGTTQTRAKIVDCGSPAADFTVAVRLSGETAAEDRACDRFFAVGEEFYTYSSTGGGGYLLCLRPKS